MQKRLIFIFLGFTLLSSCKIGTDKVPVITLNLLEQVNKYNDSTFVSYGIIKKIPENDSYVVCDYGNRLIGILNLKKNNLEIIGVQGRGPEEYPSLVSDIYADTSKIYMIGMPSLFFEYDLSKKERKVISLNKIQGQLLMSNLTYIDSNIVGQTPTFNNHLFIKYNVYSDSTTLFGMRKEENQEEYYLDVYMEDRIVTVSKFSKKPTLNIYDLNSGSLLSSCLIPMSENIKRILQTAPKAPTFDGIVVQDNRVFIAFNGVGMVTGEISRNNTIKKWTFLDYPKNITDNVILKNFIVDGEKLILFNYENPF